MNSFKKIWLLSLVPITAMALAQGGAFEPDNVVRVDTVTITRTREVPVDLANAEGCGLIYFEDGQQVMASYVDFLGDGLGWRFVDEVDGRQGRILGYRDCSGALIEADKRPASVFKR